MNQPRVHLIASNIMPADAVTSDVLGMADWLEQHGVTAEVFGGFVHPALRGRVRHLSTYGAYLGDEHDVLLYHHSVGWPAGFALWQQSRNRKVLRYHNITPGRFIQAYDRPTANLCRRGVVETANLARSGPTLALAASDFSAAELARIVERPFPIEVVPPFHGAGELDDLPVDEELAESLSETVNLLFVGRAAPHKGHTRLLRVLERCRALCGDRIRLHIVGGMDARLSPYYRELNAEAEARGIAAMVRFAGQVSARQLKTYYRHANVFLCLSEHEGFCVPLVEAMRQGVPVVAYRGSAIGSTLGDHPFLWDAPDPDAAAESIRLLLTSRNIRSSVICLQLDRYDRLFTPEAIGRRFAAALAEVLPGVSVDGIDVPGEWAPELV